MRGSYWVTIVTRMYELGVADVAWSSWSKGFGVDLGSWPAWREGGVSYLYIPL
jgi:hypothetical protein